MSHYCIKYLKVIFNKILDYKKEMLSVSRLQKK